MTDAHDEPVALPQHLEHPLHADRLPHADRVLDVDRLLDVDIAASWFLEIDPVEEAALMAQVRADAQEAWDEAVEWGSVEAFEFFESQFVSDEEVLLDLSETVTPSDLQLLDSIDPAALREPLAQLAYIRRLDALTARIAAMRLDAVVAVAGVVPSRSYLDEVHVEKELAYARRTSVTAAGLEIERARAVRQVFPRFGELVREGKVSASHLAVLVDKTRSVSDPEILARIETEILPKAPRLAPGQFSAQVTRAVTKHDPDVATRHQKARATRGVWFRTLDDGLASLTLIGSMLEVKAVHDRVITDGRTLQLARGGATAAKDNPDATADACRADAMTARMLGATNPDGSLTYDPTHASITLDIVMTETDVIAARTNTRTFPGERADHPTDTRGDMTTGGEPGPRTPTGTDGGNAGTDTGAQAPTGTDDGSMADHDSRDDSSDELGDTLDGLPAASSDPGPRTDCSTRDTDSPPTDDVDTTEGDPPSDTAPTTTSDTTTDTASVSAGAGAATCADPVTSGGDATRGVGTASGRDAGAGPHPDTGSDTDTNGDTEVPPTGWRLGLALLNGEPVPASIARDYARFATAWRRVVVDPVDGHLLDYGRRVYLPAKLREHVMRRDGGCIGPLCSTCHPSKVELEHGVPFPEGPSDTVNTRMWCITDHHLKTAGYLDITDLKPDGSATWLTAFGQRIHIPPRPFLDTPPAHADDDTYGESPGDSTARGIVDDVERGQDSDPGAPPELDEPPF